MKNILIFGKNGQIGLELRKQLIKEESNFKIESYSSKDVDFSKLNRLKRFLRDLREVPNFIINCAAYTNVDKAEEERDLADKINHRAVNIIAKYCKENDVALIHYSTDYVFDGSGNEPFSEDNTKNLKPVNYYGQTKLAGENAIINSGCKYIILRTSWVWSDNGKNFVNTIKKLAQEKEELNIINDQVGAPTSANYISCNTIKIIKKINNFEEFPSGIYHLTESKIVSWYDFSLQIVEKLKTEGINLMVKKINPIETSEYKTLAKRPLNSMMQIRKIEEVFNINNHKTT